jgi:uncharacterized protein (DUF1501 family)
MKRTQANSAHSGMTRRGFLGASAATLGLPALAQLGWIAQAQAQTAPDYKALVCVYLAGGNDHLSTVVPFDATSYSAYAQARGGLAWPTSELTRLIPLNSLGGKEIALHSSMAALKPLFDQRRAAIVGSVGPLLRPTTKAEITAGTADLPRALFSHNDQALTWQALGTEGTRYGWGGGFGDVLRSQNTKPLFTTVSASGFATFLAARQSSQFQMNRFGTALGINLVNDGETGHNVFGSYNTAPAMREVISSNSSRSNKLEREVATVYQRSLDGFSDFQSAVGGPDTLPPAPSGNNFLGEQLRAVAKVIAGRNILGARRQIFYVSIGGFDVHNGQLDRQPDLLSDVAEAIAYFDNLLEALNLRSQVTLFTSSEFGRTLVPNGDGTDHAWGGHHFVVGGAVDGGKVFGAIPSIGFDNPDHWESALIPRVSVEQYGAEFARWMGLSNAQISTVFPRFGLFDQTPLGLFRP